MVNNSVLARKRSLPGFLLGPRFSLVVTFFISLPFQQRTEGLLVALMK